jgi:2-keto-4-pentenoate hydratase/2-oxohepta-3-ene-1,7-dioic acid hydratase in catechol pathway
MINTEYNKLLCMEYNYADHANEVNIYELNQIYYKEI